MPVASHELGKNTETGYEICNSMATHARLQEFWLDRQQVPAFRTAKPHPLDQRLPSVPSPKVAPRWDAPLEQQGSRNAAHARSRLTTCELPPGLPLSAAEYRTTPVSRLPLLVSTKTTKRAREHAQAANDARGAMERAQLRWARSQHLEIAATRERLEWQRRQLELRALRGLVLPALATKGERRLQMEAEADAQLTRSTNNMAAAAALKPAPPHLLALLSDSAR
jgi:hypothetical protein